MRTLQEYSNFHQTACRLKLHELKAWITRRFIIEINTWAKCFVQTFKFVMCIDQIILYRTERGLFKTIISHWSVQSQWIKMISLICDILRKTTDSDIKFWYVPFGILTGLANIFPYSNRKFHKSDFRFNSLVGARLLLPTSFWPYANGQTI